MESDCQRVSLDNRELINEVGISSEDSQTDEPQDKLTHEMKTIYVGRAPEFLPNLGNNWLRLMLEWTFPTDGEVIAWEYFPRDTKVCANVSVWRKTGEQTYGFKLVGENELPPAHALQTQYVELNTADRIKVKRGDIIGIFYSQYNINGSIANAVDKQGVGEKDLSSVLTAEVFEEDIDGGDVIDFSQTNMEIGRQAFALRAKMQTDINKLDEHKVD